MATEQDQGSIFLHKVHIIFEAEDQTAVMRSLDPSHYLSQLLVSSLLRERVAEQVLSSGRDDVIAAPPPQPIAEVHDAPLDSPPGEATAAQPKNPAVVLSGRLKTQPKEGKSDGQGHPTAWARFAAHEEGHEKGHLYSCTFHRGATRIALGLPVEAQIVVEGYAHPSTQPGKRLDTLSVFRLLHYPGKPEKS